MSWQTIKSLKEQRSKVWEEAKQFNDSVEAEERAMTDEEQAKWDRFEEDLSDYDKRIEELEAVEEKAGSRRSMLDAVQEKLKRSGMQDSPVGKSQPDGSDRGLICLVTEEHRSLALQGWMFRQSGLRVCDNHAEAAALCNIDLDAKEIEIGLRNRMKFGEQRSMNVGTDADGGFTIPEGFINNLEQALLAFGGVRQEATVLRTSSGNDLPWPTVNDTGNTGALLAEETSIGASVDPTFSRVVFNAYKYSSTPVLISPELLQDSAFNLATWLGRALAERIARAQSAHFTTGAGTSQPNGIVTAATVGKTAAAATALTFDELIDLIHSVDPAYRPMARFMFHDNVLAAIRKLKDNDNQYLWQPSNQSGEASRLLGYGYRVNQQMASSIAASAKTVLFGDLSKYMIRDVATIRLRRLVERYADTDQEAFIAFMRSDGDLLDAGTNPVKVLQQAAV